MICKDILIINPSLHLEYTAVKNQNQATENIPNIKISDCSFSANIIIFINLISHQTEIYNQCYEI